MAKVDFPSIESFHNICKLMDVYPDLYSNKPINYRGKIKLHGTFSSVRIFNGEIFTQSGTQIINIKDDNQGFAKFIELKSDFFKSLSSEEEVTICGEFAGKGINSGTAIQQLPNKIFAIFSIMIGEDCENCRMITDPDSIRKYLLSKEMALPSDIYILPWYGKEYIIDFNTKETLPEFAKEINALIDEIEPTDPWVKETFNIKGVCEGIVYYPGAGKEITRKMFSDLAFKAKGEKHKSQKTKEAVQIDPQIAKSVDDFANIFATENRFEQAINVLGANFDMKQLGQFLKWVHEDIIKESKAELAASGLVWKQCNRKITQIAKEWFISKQSDLIKV